MGESGVLKKELLMLLFVVVKSLDDGGLQAVGWGWSGDLKMLIIISVTRLGYFLKVLVTNSSKKVAQTLSDILGDFENHLFLCKNGYDYFLCKF